MRILLAGLAGGIMMFVWTSIAHMALPLGHIGFSGIPDEAPVMAVIQKSLGDHPGLYFYPWVDPRKSDAMAEVTAKLKTNPSGLLIYRPPGGGGMTASMLIVEFAKEFAVSLIAAFLLARSTLAAYAARAGSVALIGLAATLTTNVSYWNWYQFPTDYTLASMATEFVGYLAAGLAIAAILPRRPGFRPV
jgi:hypothetical protein